MLPKTLMRAEGMYHDSHEVVEFNDLGGMNYEIRYEHCDPSGQLLAVDVWGSKDYEDAMHQFAIVINDFELEIK